MKPLKMNLDPRYVAAPAQRVAITAAQTVAAALAAFVSDELPAPTSGTSMVYQFSFGGIEQTSDERRAMYQNWLGCKGLQDLARGVRESLESAFVYSTLVANAPLLTTTGKLRSKLEDARECAQALKFPKLLDQVNAKLTAPVQFDAEMRSLQEIRNCLEHRGGIVAKRDLNGRTELTLKFTRRRLFYKLESGEEVECVPGQNIENPAKLSNAPIMLGAVAVSRCFGLGQSVTLDVADFNEIVVNCNLFANDLVNKLPVLSTAP